jgi:acetyl-CoA C-acetyltransferase
MAEGIKDKVAVIGMGCTHFGELWNSSAEDLMVEAFGEALADAGIAKDDLGAAWLANCFDEVNLGKSAIPLAIALKLPFIPVTRVENFCASGTEAFRGACYAVASGACDFALAMGVEKLKDTGYGGLPDFGQSLGTRNRLTFPNMTAPGAFAMMATRYFDRYGLSREEGKRILAHVSAKSHHAGALIPRPTCGWRSRSRRSSSRPSWPTPWDCSTAAGSATARPVPSSPPPRSPGSWARTRSTSRRCRSRSRPVRS